MDDATKGGWTIRPARADEAASLSALALRSKAHWGYDAAFMTACAEELSITPEELVAHHARALEQDGALLGFYTLEPCDAPGAIELGHLFVEPAWIGRGCGGALLRHAARHARALGHRTLVIQGDPHAAGFYEALGGRRVGARASESIPGRTLPVFHLALLDP